MASTVVAAVASVILGIPRLKAWRTPRLQRAWVVSAALGDDIARAAPRQVLAGTPVTLFAVVETGQGNSRRYFGAVERAQLGGGDGPIVEVEQWSNWWNGLEVLWFKVEPLYPFDNENLTAEFTPADVQYDETLMVAWGFELRHAADVAATGDAFPRLDVGTMRFKVQAVVTDSRGRILDEAFSPGAEGVHADAPEDQPHRVTVRSSNLLLGILRGYAGLPYVPFLGTLPPGQHPADRFVAGTVLDFWIATQRGLGARDLPFMSWEQLPDYADTVVDDMFLARDGAYYYTHDPLRPVTWDEVQVGDLLAIEDHVGVLFQDRGPGGGGDGVVNRWDRLLGGYFEPLREMPLGDAFVEGVTVYRLGAVAAEPGSFR